MAEYVLTDGKNYVMENEFQEGQYLQTTYCQKAKRFTYKQARSLVQNARKKYSWIKNYQLLDVESGKECEHSLFYKGGNGIYEDKDFDDAILGDITNEANAIINLAGWSGDQLEKYKKQLNDGLSQCDSAESDIKHALQTYKERNNGKKPQAHKMAKIGYMLDEIRDRHKRIKQCQRYIAVMQDSITYHYTLSKFKSEVKNVKFSEYKGRTKYYQDALDILES